MATFQDSFQRALETARAWKAGEDVQPFIERHLVSFIELMDSLSCDRCKKRETCEWVVWGLYQQTGGRGWCSEFAFQVCEPPAADPREEKSKGAKSPIQRLL